MATAKEVITDALFDIQVKQEGTSLEASEELTGVRYLNDLMTSWDAMGICLGFTAISKISDPVTVPDGALMGIKAQLSINLAAQFNGEVTAALAQRAKEGYSAILNLAIEVGASEYPATLPSGSGNSEDYNFYPERQSTILTETGGSIALEDDTEEAS